MKEKPSCYCLVSGRCPRSLLEGNLFSQKQCEYAINIQDIQGNDSMLLNKSVLFLQQSAPFR